MVTCNIYIYVIFFGFCSLVPVFDGELMGILHAARSNASRPGRCVPMMIHLKFRANSFFHGPTEMVVFSCFASIFSKEGI